MSNPDLNVALEEGALKRLQTIQDVFPPGLADKMKGILARTDSSSSPPAAQPTVPYSLLLAISRWARTDAGRESLLVHQPPQDPREFDMITLLAGSTTSPEKHFPMPAGGWAEEERARKRETNDRRAVTNVINAMLSIGGCGIATWYAAGATGWQNEWRVLLGLLAAVLVAIAEAALYIIWTSVPSSPRRPTKLKKRRRGGSPPPAHDLSGEKAVGSLDDTPDGLRHRHIFVESAGSSASVHVS